MRLAVLVNVRALWLILHKTKLKSDRELKEKSPGGKSLTLNCLSRFFIRRWGADTSISNIKKIFGNCRFIYPSAYFPRSSFFDESFLSGGEITEF